MLRVKPRNLTKPIYYTRAFHLFSDRRARLQCSGSTRSSGSRMKCALFECDSMAKFFDILAFLRLIIKFCIGVKIITVGISRCSEIRGKLLVDRKLFNVINFSQFYTIKIYSFIPVFFIQLKEQSLKIKMMHNIL